MRHEDEIKRGIEYLKGIIESGKVLRLSDPRVLGNFNYWYYFLVTAYSKQWDFAVSRDELSDLPGTRKYQQSALELAHGLEQRFKNISPSLFFCASGRLIETDVEWPYEAWPGRTATYVKVRVTDKGTNEFAYCFVILTHQQGMFELKEDPFQQFSATANSIRESADEERITFCPSVGAHPRELQEVNLRFGARKPRDIDVGQYLKRKVLAMGFKSGGKDTQVWIADPWDAEYLGVSTQLLRQEADILEAEEFLTLSEDRMFASAGKELLLEGKNMSLVSQCKDLVTIEHTDGTRHENVKAMVTGTTIFVPAAEVPISMGDVVLRQLPSGIVERLKVTEPTFYHKVSTIPAHYQLKYTRQGQQPEGMPGYKIHVTGDNARINIGSIDNSVNIQNKQEPVDLQKLAGELSQLRAALVKVATTAEEHQAIGIIATAEIEAKKGQEPKALKALSAMGTAGKWVLDGAKSIGIALATAVIKAHLGI